MEIIKKPSFLQQSLEWANCPWDCCAYDLCACDVAGCYPDSQP